MLKHMVVVMLAGFILASCSSDKDNKASKESVQPAASGLTETQLVNGVGPYSSFELQPLDQALADAGKEIFDLKCVACHKPNERLVGPPLSGVLERRSPAFVLNMILNPAEMVEKHPEVRAMLAQYYVPMTFQNVTDEDAKAILEYLRTL